MTIKCYNHVEERWVARFEDIKTALDQELYDKKVSDVRTTLRTLSDMIGDAECSRENDLVNQLSEVYDVIRDALDRFTAGDAEQTARLFSGEEMIFDV